jgi:uncharacterized protein YceH (UPF0502 family)
MSSSYYAGPIPPTAVELRVLGALIEKRRTTPDAYPLSVNALRLACNQSTNRDPVVDYDEHTILDALEHLGRRGWTRLASGAGSRARKYRHLFDDALDLADDELALLCVLMLRGPQTPGELKQRTERLHAFADLAALEETLDVLIARDLAARLPRRPGQKEQRYVQLLDGGESPDEPAVPTASSTPIAASPSVPAELDGSGDEPDRLAALERDVANLKDEVARLRDLLGG